MPQVKPIKRKDLIFYLKKFDFIGPFSGGKHEFMIKGNIRLTLPNPHKGDIGKGLLKKDFETGKN
jgi:hypothetical protein